MATLTAANAVITLTIPGIFSIPQQLQQFAVDDVADVDTLTIAETLMGVDGFLSGGFVFNAVKYTFTLQADSPSCFLFDQWKNAQATLLDTFPCNGGLLLKSLGTKWTWTRGFLVDYSPAPNIKKILQPRKFGVVFQRVFPQPT